jgi:serine/threonine protein kinase, bacterial
MDGQLLCDRYQIISVLGAGGMGQTFVAEDTQRPGNPKCVVKMLKPASNDPNFLATASRLFIVEAEMLEKLGSNPQIPHLLASFERYGNFYLVQEFIDGQPLGTELPLGHRWSEEQVVEMLKGILPVLEFIHGQGVIHRDIKPDNIMRRRQDGQLVLIDFGAVKQVRTQQTMAVGQMSMTVAIGTPGYMPTEQSSGKPRPNSDIYALGMIGIQALTGLWPAQLREDEDGEVIWRDQAQVSEGLATVLTMMTKHYFKHRYQTATEVLQALAGMTAPNVAVNVGYTPTQQVGNDVYTPTAVAPSYNPTVAPVTVNNTVQPNVVSQQLQPDTAKPVASPVNIGYQDPPKKKNVLLLLGGGVGILSIFLLFLSMLAHEKTVPSSSSAPKVVAQGNACEVNVTEGNNVRTEGTPSASIMNEYSNLGERKAYPISGRTSGEWMEIKLPNGRLGWVHKGVISETFPDNINKCRQENPTTISSKEVSKKQFSSYVPPTPKTSPSTENKSREKCIINMVGNGKSEADASAECESIAADVRANQKPREIQVSSQNEKDKAWAQYRKNCENDEFRNNPQKFETEYRSTFDQEWEKSKSPPKQCG